GSSREQDGTVGSLFLSETRVAVATIFTDGEETAGGHVDAALRPDSACVDVRLSSNRIDRGRGEGRGDLLDFIPGFGALYESSVDLVGVAYRVEIVVVGLLGAASSGRNGREPPGASCEVLLLPLRLVESENVAGLEAARSEQGADQ